ncbi:MAG: nuclear transport factor 2 family protein [Alphaproteobacteria bacterium]|nr:nuclear transport factor 2 family protein [Alphaproteobacteria bacterium]
MDTKTMTTADSKKIVADFLASWQARDIARIMSYFAPDAVYHNVPVAPIKGHDGIRAIFQAFLDAFDDVDLEVVTLVGEGDRVASERVDHFKLGGKRFDLPVHGVFELKNGKITRFSDYFDLASFEGPSGMKL